MNPRALVLLLAIAAVAAKTSCAATTTATSDVKFFYDFAWIIHQQGLLAMYRQAPFFNHTPLVGWASEAALFSVWWNRGAALRFAGPTALTVLVGWSYPLFTLICQGLPWREGFTVHSIADRWAAGLVLPWLTLVAFLVNEARWKNRPATS